MGLDMILYFQEELLQPKTIILFCINRFFDGFLENPFLLNEIVRLGPVLFDETRNKGGKNLFEILKDIFFDLGIFVLFYEPLNFRVNFLLQLNIESENFILLFLFAEFFAKLLTSFYREKKFFVFIFLFLQFVEIHTESLIKEKVVRLFPIIHY